jgi:hypothetical protein
MLLEEAGSRERSTAGPVPSARAVSVLSEMPISYAGPTAGDRRRYAFAALVMGLVTLAVALAPHVFGFDGWMVATAGLIAVLLGGVAWHQAPWLGSLGRISATLGMTTGLAASTLMLYPFL